MTDPAPSPWRARIALLVTLVLLAAAGWAVARDPPGLRDAVRAARGTPAPLLLLFAFLPLANWAWSALTFWALTRTPRALPPRDMLALIGAGNLLNYLPFRAGLVGRVAFHRAVHGIPVRTSVAVVGMAIAATAIGAALALALAVLATRLPVGGDGAALPLVMAACAGLPAAILTPAARRGSASASFACAAGLRAADTLTWAARYALAFQIVGRAIDPAQAVGLAVVAQAAMMVPLFGNGLGLREWAVAIVATVLPAASGTGPGAGIPTPIGLSADLLNRAADLLIAVPVGLVGAASLARTLRSAPRGASGPARPVDNSRTIAPAAPEASTAPEVPRPGGR